jgi:hypothetical protein
MRPTVPYSNGIYKRLAKHYPPRMTRVPNSNQTALYPKRWVAEALRGTAALIGLGSLVLTAILAGVIGYVVALASGRSAADVGSELGWFGVWLAGLGVVVFGVFVVQLLVAPSRIEARARATSAQALAAVEAERDGYRNELRDLKRDIENRELRFTLSLEGSRLIGLDDSDSARDAWLEARTKELLDPVPPPVPEYVKNFLGGLPASMTGGDTRSTGEFRTEVHDYIDEVRATWPQLVARRLIENRVSRLHVAVSNPTDRRFDGFTLTLVLPEGVVAGWDGTDENWEFVPPEAPARWGSQTAFMPWYSSRIPDVGNFTVTTSTADIQKVGERVRVTYAEVDLHQRAETVELDELNLVVPSSLAGQVLRFDYFATARDTRGRSEGFFDLQVLPELFPVATLLAASDGGQSEQGDEEA